MHAPRYGAPIVFTRFCSPPVKSRTALMAPKIRPLLLGEAIVPNRLDVFWSLSPDQELSSVPILAFLVLGAEVGPILIDCGMRDPCRATDIHKLGPHTVASDQTLAVQLEKHGVSVE